MDKSVDKIRRNLESTHDSDLIEMWADKETLSAEKVEAIKQILIARKILTDGVKENNDSKTIAPFPESLPFSFGAMVKKTIKIGDQEIHELTLIKDNLSNPSVKLNGQKIKGKLSFIGNGIFEFPVGSQELHNVKVVYTASVVTLNEIDKFSVFVDGQLVHGPEIEVIKNEKNKEIIVDKKAGESSVIGMILNNQILRWIPLVVGFIIFKNGPAAVPFVIAFLYPIVIYFDSKKRLGKPTWGWTIGGFFLFIGGLVQFNNILITEEGNSFISANLGSLIGGLVGLWLGNFFLYRAFTKKAAALYSEGKRKTHGT